MNILITGAAGFVGKNLTAALECIRDGGTRPIRGWGWGSCTLRHRLRPGASGNGLPKGGLRVQPRRRQPPENQEEFMQGNFGFASTLLDMLKKYHNTCPVMLSSSIQATMVGRYAGSEYGKRQKGGEVCFSPTPPRPGRRCWCTASQTCSENGAAPTTIPLWPPSATTMPTTCPSR